MWRKRAGKKRTRDKARSERSESDKKTDAISFSIS
jgi:hypothetical protein